MKKKKLGAATPRNCPECNARGKTWQGDNPTCAFPDFAEIGEAAAFSADNWNCATMNAIRDLAERDGAAREYSEDQYAALLPDDGAFLVLGWYKRRGRTEVAAMLSGEDLTALTYADAARALNASKASAPQAPPSIPKATE